MIGGETLGHSRQLLALHRTEELTDRSGSENLAELPMAFSQVLA
jgi:hypothetical protein